MKELKTQYNYINRVIRSCNHQLHIDACRKMISDYMDRFSKNIVEAIQSKIYACELASRILKQQEVIESYTLMKN